MRSWLLLFAFFHLASAHTMAGPEFPITIESPDHKVQVRIEKGPGKSLTYAVYYQQQSVLAASDLGLATDKASWVKKMKIAAVSDPLLITDTYSLYNDKKRTVTYTATERSITLKKKKGVTLRITFRVSDLGVGFRYELVGDPGLKIKVLQEKTNFTVAPNANTWMYPHAPSRSGWEKTQPCYEEYATLLTVDSLPRAGSQWSFPALFETSGGWLWISETGINRNYAGAHLTQSSSKGKYQLSLAPAVEVALPGEEALPHGQLPITSPWRILQLGPKLGALVEGTLVTDLAEPGDTSSRAFVTPGLAAWTWNAYKDDSTVYHVQKRVVDHAARMGWPYVLVDAMWDTQIGRAQIAQLSAYAQSRGVRLWLWYNTNGQWNGAPQTPKDKMYLPEQRKSEMAWLKSIGVAGVKVDFFGGDGQPFMALYEDILRDAAAHGLGVNFHGATLPRGWHRTYPHLLSMEAVRGFEYVTFNQADADQQAKHSATLPFMRQLAGPMDYTPMSLNSPPGIQRKTSTAFELALAILFQSGIQHISSSPESIQAQPAAIQALFRQIPAQWEDIQFLAGYPGEYIALARKHGQQWWVAGINAGSNTKEFKMDFSSLQTGTKGVIYRDGDQPGNIKQQPFNSSKLSLNIPANSGFVIHFPAPMSGKE